MSDRIQDILLKSAGFKGKVGLAKAIAEVSNRKWLSGSATVTIQSELSKLLNPSKYPAKKFTTEIFETLQSAIRQKRIDDGQSVNEAEAFALQLIRQLKSELSSKDQSPSSEIDSFFQWVDKTFYLVSIANRPFKLSKNPASQESSDLVLLINRAIKYIALDMSHVTPDGTLNEKKIRFNLPDESNCIDQWKALHYLICDFILSLDESNRNQINDSMKQTSVLIQEKIALRKLKDPNEFPELKSTDIESVLSNLNDEFSNKSIKDRVAIYLTQLSRNDNIRIYKHERLPIFEIPIVMFDFDDSNDPAKFGAFLLHFNKRNQFLVEELTNPQKQTLNRNYWKRIKNAHRDVKGLSVLPYFSLQDFENAASFLGIIK